MTSRDRRTLSLLLAVALVLRLTWAVAQPRSAGALDRLPDQREYLSLGLNLLHGGSLHFFDPRFGQDVYAYRLPGYPLLVAACGGSVLVVRLVQAVIDTSTVLATFLLARQVLAVVRTDRGPCNDRPEGAPFARPGPPNVRSGRPLDGESDVPGRCDTDRGHWRTSVAVAAAGWVAVNPSYVYFSGLVLTETAFAAAATWGLLCLAGRAWRPAVACFAAAAYLRPTTLLLAPALAAVAAVPNRAGDRAYHWKLAAVVPSSLILVLLPWAWRNAGRVGTPVWTTTNDGVTLYDGFHDGATGASDQRFLADVPGLRSMNEVDRSRDLAGRAERWIVGHPGRLPRLVVRKVARGWSPVPLSAEFGRPLYRLVGGAYAVPFDLLCLIGLCSRRVPWAAKLLLVAPAVVLTAAQVMTVGSIRYRMPAEAPLAVLAGVGAVEVWVRVRHPTGNFQLEIAS